MPDGLLTGEEMKAINDSMPPEAKYGDVFSAIAKAQLAKGSPDAETLIEQAKREERERILALIWPVVNGVGRGSGRISKANLQALKANKE